MFPKILFTILLAGLIVLTACDVLPGIQPQPTPVAFEDYDTYVVQKGDTISLIAARYYLTIEQLIALNDEHYPQLVRDPSLLQPGWRLRVPSPSAVKAARTTAESSGQFDFEQTADQVIEQINAARAQRGMTALRKDVTLTRIASDRSADMIARNYFSHNDPQTGQQPFLRYLQATKYAYHSAGENIAEIKNDAAWVPPWLTVVARYSSTALATEFVTGWLNSPEHRANIFGSQYHRTGVALVPSGDSRRVVATQVFSD